MEAARRRQVDGGARQGGRRACGARATAGVACCKVARCAREFESAPGILRPRERTQGSPSSNMNQQDHVEASDQA